MRRTIGHLQKMEQKIAARNILAMDLWILWYYFSSEHKLGFFNLNFNLKMGQRNLESWPS